MHGCRLQSRLKIRKIFAFRVKFLRSRQPWILMHTIVGVGNEFVQHIADCPFDRTIRAIVKWLKCYVTEQNIHFIKTILLISRQVLCYIYSLTIWQNDDLIKWRLICQCSFNKMAIISCKNSYEIARCLCVPRYFNFVVISFHNLNSLRFSNFQVDDLTSSSA